MTRGEFLDRCRAVGLSDYWSAVADTIVRYESQYYAGAIRVEDSGGEGNTSYGLFQVLGKYSPMHHQRESGLRFTVSEQFEEWWLYMQSPYLTGPNVSQWEMFRRYNGSGPAAERYADRAMKYMRETWPQFVTDPEEVILADMSPVLSPDQPTTSAQASPVLGLALAAIIGYSLL